MKAMTHSDEVARRIANRETELQRSYDRYKQDASKALADLKDARERLEVAEEGIAKCIRRAEAQDCVGILYSH